MVNAMISRWNIVLVVVGFVSMWVMGIYSS